jgi:hypothetical protein
MPGASARFSNFSPNSIYRGDGVGGNGLSWLDGIYHDGVETFFIDKAPAWARRWRNLIEESDTQTSARAYEAATAWAVRQGLRNGSLYSKYGFDYADPSSHWMPPEIWKGRRSGYQLEKDLCRFSFMLALFAFHGGTSPSGIEADERLVSSMNINLQ